jgi:DNA-binding beta-propeller fold protein YncE
MLETTASSVKRLSILLFITVIAITSMECGSKRTACSVFGSLFTNKPYIITLLDPIDPPSSVSKFIGTDLASSSFKDIKFSGGDLWAIMKDLGKTPTVVVGQPFALIGSNLGRTPYVSLNHRICPLLFHVRQGDFGALLLQVHSNARSGRNEVRAHSGSRSSIYMPIKVHRLGVVANTDRKSLTRFNVLNGLKYKEDLEVPDGYRVDDVVISRDGLFIFAADTTNDAFMIWPIEDLPMDLIDKEGSLEQVQFPITLNIKEIPGADKLPPVAFNPRGVAISKDGDFLACALSNLASIIIVNISNVNDLESLVKNNNIDDPANFSLSIVNLSLTDRPTRLGFSRSGKYVLSTNYASHSVSVINNEVTPAELIGTIDLSAEGRNPQELDFSIEPDTRHDIAYVVLAFPAAGSTAHSARAGSEASSASSTSGKGKVVSFDLSLYAQHPETPPELTRYTVGNLPVGIAVGMIDDYALVSNFSDNNLSVIDLIHRRVLEGTISCNGGPTCVEICNSEGTFNVSNRLDNSMTVIYLDENGKARRKYHLDGLSQPQAIAVQQRNTENEILWVKSKPLKPQALMLSTFSETSTRVASSISM